MRLTVNRLATAVALLLLTAPLAAEAQQAGKIPRIGVLGATSPDTSSPYYALREGLREFGYLEGQNIAIEWRWARGDATRFPDLASELVRLKVDVIVAGNDPATEAAQRATKTIPIVMVIASDPVRSGFIASLARPGGTITGLSAQGPVAGKGLQILKEAAPNISRVAILWDPTTSKTQGPVKETEIAAKKLGLNVQILGVRSPNELGRAFQEMGTAHADAVVVRGSAMLFANRVRIAEQATKNRLPALCPFREYVEAGCLMSYWTSAASQVRRAAYFVDKILRGAKPADLPVEQPTTFELVINMKTARVLGLTIPPSLLLRADQIID